MKEIIREYNSRRAQFPANNRLVFRMGVIDFKVSLRVDLRIDFPQSFDEPCLMTRLNIVRVLVQDKFFHHFLINFRNTAGDELDKKLNRIAIGESSAAE